MKLSDHGELQAIDAGAFDQVECSLCKRVVEGGSVIKGRSGRICENCADEEYPKPVASFVRAANPVTLL